MRFDELDQLTVGLLKEEETVDKRECFMETIGIKLALTLVVLPFFVWFLVWRKLENQFITRLILVVCILSGVSLVTMFGRDGAGRHAAEKSGKYSSQDQRLAWFDGAQSVTREIVKYDSFYFAAYLFLAIVALLPSRVNREGNKRNPNEIEPQS